MLPSYIPSKILIHSKVTFVTLTKGLEIYKDSTIKRAFVLKLTRKAFDWLDGLYKIGIFGFWVNNTPEDDRGKEVFFDLALNVTGTCRRTCWAWAQVPPREGSRLQIKHIKNQPDIHHQRCLPPEVKFDFQNLTLYIRWHLSNFWVWYDMGSFIYTKGNSILSHHDWFHSRESRSLENFRLPLVI